MWKKTDNSENISEPKIIQKEEAPLFIILRICCFIWYLYNHILKRLVDTYGAGLGGIGKCFVYSGALLNTIAGSVSVLELSLE